MVQKANATTAKKAKSPRRVSSLDSDPGVTRETLEVTPLRALALLRGIGTSKPIMLRMRAYGFAREDAEEGWELLHAASGFHDDAGDDDDRVSTDARKAIAELDALDETLFRVLRATLKRRAPSLAASVLDGLSATEGPGVIVNLTKLLDRLDAAAKKLDTEGKAAFAALEERGYGENERTRLRDLITRAQSVPDVDEESPKARAAAEAEHLQALRALRIWYEEWAEIARVAVTRRDHLIRLGLASRRSPAAETTTPSAPTPAP
ncbi:MAG TPA: hypothetical protein VHM70_11500 [Polyangiaceae bacterium]|jgi:hypothetical protein|nr:hypothetical protein [Polyangiaceae bacterium]